MCETLDEITIKDEGMIKTILYILNINFDEDRNNHTIHIPKQEVPYGTINTLKEIGALPKYLKKENYIK